MYTPHAEVNKATKKKIETVLDEQLEDRVMTILADKMPTILYNHDLEVRDRYKNDR
jgi:hypothetical protein